MTKQSDIDTDKITRTIAEIQARQRPPSGEFRLHECKQEGRIGKLEDRVDAIDRQLTDGQVEFAKLHKDIEALTAAVNGLKSIVAWVGGTIGVGLLTTAGGALVWVIGKMGAAP